MIENPCQAVAIALCISSYGWEEDVCEHVPQEVWDRLHDLGYLRSGRDSTGEGYTACTPDGEKALMAYLDAQSRKESPGG